MQESNSPRTRTCSLQDGGGEAGGKLNEQTIFAVEGEHLHLLFHHVQPGRLGFFCEA